MEPKIVTKPAFAIVGMKYHGENKGNEIPQLWNEFMQHTTAIEHVVNPEMCYGACANLDEATGEFDYLAAFEVSANTAVPAGMARWDVPANTYAVFSCTLPTIQAAFANIYNTWLPNSAYERAPGPEFELYDETFDPQDPNSTFYIYVPVQKA
ncbi:MAG: GyrI-like domain-containing protein [Chloroflexota bacterium]